ncbi:MAG TPA: tRNA (adenosine(37)-N6)-dimethylallyltransferase MiaA [Burkholderiales bacterium]|nr:tRNA (adenosine(37)-N6)-dimethylallyltransferase MiaA [Burkholderiales bacterium]
MARGAYALLGPTASGKSALALELADRVPLEIVSMDSAQVYRGMDIGTAKPGAPERTRVPHHLIDIVDPDASYSTGRWRADAIGAMRAILERGRTPLLVGGTMLYYRALVSGIDTLPQADAQLRAEIDADAARLGWPALHARLAEVDPRAAQRIAPNDSQRIQRALEVWRLTGKPLSTLQGSARPALPFPLKAFACLPRSREALHERIAARFDAMLQAGLVEELAALRARYRLAPGMPSMRTVGYRQAWDFLEGKTQKSEMRERAIAATRQLAKRQLTWLRSFPGLFRLDAGGPQDAAVALHLLLHELR